MQEDFLFKVVAQGLHSLLFMEWHAYINDTHMAHVDTDGCELEIKACMWAMRIIRYDIPSLS